MFWLWLSYQAIKGSLTLTFIWIPLFLLWRKNGGFQHLIPDWGAFIAANVVFFGVHILLSTDGIRTRLHSIFGNRGYITAHILLSLLVFAWAIYEAMSAPRIPLWSVPVWQQWLGLVLLGLASLLMGFGLMIANPFSVFSGSGVFDPDRPGILALTRHPVFVSIIFWAGAHILVNGDLASTILFGLQIPHAAIGAFVLDGRSRKSMGNDNWSALARRTQFVPNPLGIKTIITSGGISMWGRKLVVSALLFIGLGGLHAFVFGVQPFAGLI